MAWTFIFYTNSKVHCVQKSTKIGIIIIWSIISLRGQYLNIWDTKYFKFFPRTFFMYYLIVTQNSRKHSEALQTYRFNPFQAFLDDTLDMILLIYPRYVLTVYMYLLSSCTHFCIQPFPGAFWWYSTILLLHPRPQVYFDCVYLHIVLVHPIIVEYIGYILIPIEFPTANQH